VQTETSRLNAPSAEMSAIQQVLFVRDSSASMGGLVDGAPLDVVTLAVFSVIKTLDATGRSVGMRFGFADFSDRTLWSGWVRRESFRRFEKVALTNQEGGTTLDVSVLDAALRNQPRTLILLMTDGELSLTNGNENDLTALLTDHQSFVMASHHAVRGFCGHAASAGVTTLLLPSLADIEPVFATLLGQRAPE
jgi:hypothetical protein